VIQQWLDNAADDPAVGYTAADFSGSVYGIYTCRKR
jgi:hypothetical protein